MRPAEHAHVVRQHLPARPQTDHGVKADELATLLDELFEQPETKAVIFSQWLRMHELLIRRLEARGLGYVASTAACQRTSGRS